MTRDNTRIGVDIATLLHQSETLVNSVADTRLRELLHETFTAFNGSGPELARLIESARLLVDEANADFPQTSQLIDQVGPFLQAQIRSGDDIKSLSDGLARFTSEVRQADPQLRDAVGCRSARRWTRPIRRSPVSARRSRCWRPTWPTWAGSASSITNRIEQLLVVLPALFAAIITAANGEPQDEGAKLDFKINIDPPPCNTGFIPPPLIRTPADETVREIPTDMYCKTAQNDPSTVRGARNYPCQEFPGKRAPTVALCRDPRGYVPTGTNPWRGPPIPYGTPVTNGLNILPPNKFPFIPPGADPDPGTPIAGPLPPGVVPGPGPAPFQPFPVPAAAQHRRHRWSAGLDTACAVPAAAARDAVPEGGSSAPTTGRPLTSSAISAAGEAVGPTARAGAAGQRRGLHHLRPEHRSFPGPRRRHWYLRARQSIERRELGGPDA